MIPTNNVASLVHYLAANGCTERNQVTAPALFERHIATAIVCGYVRAGGSKDSDDYRRLTFTPEGLHCAQESMRAFLADRGDRFPLARRLKLAGAG